LRVEVGEVELTTARTRAHDLLERAIHGIVRTDPIQRTVLYANPAAAEMLGYADGEDLMRRVRNVDRDLYADESAGTAFRKDVEVAGSIRDLTSRTRRKDGTVIWVRENTWPVLSDAR